MDQGRRGRDRRSCDRMIVGFITTYASRVKCTILCDKVCQ